MVTKASQIRGLVDLSIEEENYKKLRDVVKSNTVDWVNSPPHYNNHPSGIEPIELTQHMNFCLGNVLKYVFRADLKGNPIEDLEKAKYYLNKEIEKRIKLDRG